MSESMSLRSILPPGPACQASILELHQFLALQALGAPINVMSGGVVSILEQLGEGFGIAGFQNFGRGNSGLCVLKRGCQAVS
ncbi:hypothetical protein WJX79_009393 [Trebouxia sp. C0005]